MFNIKIESIKKLEPTRVEELLVKYVVPKFKIYDDHEFVLKRKVIKTYNFAKYLLTETAEVFRVSQDGYLKKLKPYETGGYLRIDLPVDGGKFKSFKLHILMAHSFDLKYNGPEKNPRNLLVEHIDGIKTNCKLTNLRYGTYRDNTRHAQVHIKGKVYLDDDVRAYIDGEIKRGRSTQEIADELNVPNHVIRDYKNGKTYI